ncbi:MAG: hypothetical protein QUU85_14605 [Candidatus Eisenbacteria bacterium]|nr:hypothetical protein [Candidatus Eisenbacteria bacterium]
MGVELRRESPAGVRDRVPFVLSRVSRPRISAFALVGLLLLVLGAAAAATLFMLRACPSSPSLFF